MSGQFPAVYIAAMTQRWTVNYNDIFQEVSHILVAFTQEQKRSSQRGCLPV